MAISWPVINIKQLNQYQGEPKDIERKILFIGYGANNRYQGKTVPVNSNTNLVEMFGNTLLAEWLRTASLNAGANWFAYVHVLPTAEFTTAEWRAAVHTAQSVASAEGVVLVKEDSDKTDINAANELRDEIISQYSRWQWFCLPVAALKEKENWSDAVSRLTKLQEGIAAPAVMLTPVLFGNEPGALAGRLCNRSVTVADSPARVKTGALLALGSDTTPIDNTGQPLGLDTLQALAQARFTVPLWYNDYDGLYFGVGLTLDVDGGDFTTIENVRIIDKVARRIRLMAIPKIADRSMNSTASSVKAHESYFMSVLREMAKSITIGAANFPGEVKPPHDGDITINWLNSKRVQIYVKARPYEMPIEINIGLMLDFQLGD